MSSTDESRRGEASNGDTLEDSERSGTPTAWRIRAGSKGEIADLFIKNSLAVLGFGKLPDLSQFSSRDEIAELISSEEPEATEARVRSRVAQLWTLISKVRRGDVVVTPRQGNSQFALGTVTQEYWYRSDAEDMRHAVSVDWKRTDVPRTAVKQDLLNSIDTPGTIRPIKSHDGAWRIQHLLETGQDPGPRDGHDNEAPDLSALVEQFLAESGYPTEAHQEQERLREEWAKKLAPENVADLSRHDLTVVASRGNWWAGTYGYPQATGVMQWIQDLTDEEYSRMLDHIRYLCSDKDELWRRYDQLMNQDSPRKTKGLAETTASKLVAICRPEDFLAIGVQGGRWGRRAMLDRLGLPKPAGSSLGQRVVDANNRLREHLEPHFSDDTLGMGAFLGWLLERERPAPPRPPSRTADLAELADELLVEASFLKDIVSLLEDKGQVILYGPPGTGKTYLARELAKVLAPDESCRALVQFHPSTSYEDFFEGYRPAGTGKDGGIRFELTHGPLARIAERASDARGEQHVMIIDEINRGNLPRVLGELLFLLEYRDEKVETLYRTEERFSLPENLWFIGTMNTADRSIALVDAALRRRFHFIPFFPDRKPMAGLLRRWLAREGEPAWVGDLVDSVNAELTKELAGSHLLLGPSHFMKDYGSSPDEQRERLRRIWKYNIEPFIEDQFFGNLDQIERFRFDEVMKRNRAAESEIDTRDDGDDPENIDDSEVEHAAAAEPDSTRAEDEQ